MLEISKCEINPYKHRENILQNIVIIAHEINDTGKMHM